ncbi:MAG: hypothetical protein K9L56_14240 [Clostridiales bacterium]|nr:hypothetical protein [Clostridiales bacterium]
MGMQDALQQAAEEEGMTDSGNQTDNQSGQSESTEESDLPPKYQGKSAEEIAEMHNNLENKLGEQSQQIAELRGRVEAQSGRSEDEQQEEQVPSKDKLIDDVVENLPEDALDMETEDLVNLVANTVDTLTDAKVDKLREESIEPIQNQAMEQESLQAVQHAAQKHSDFDQYVDDIQEVISKPVYRKAVANASLDDKVAILEDAYHMVKGQKSNGQSGSNAGKSTGGASTRPSLDSQKEKLGERVKDSLVG